VQTTSNESHRKDGGRELHHLVLIAGRTTGKQTGGYDTFSTGVGDLDMLIIV
jgi:hypothetical protein